MPDLINGVPRGTPTNILGKHFWPQWGRDLMQTQPEHDRHWQAIDADLEAKRATPNRMVTLSPGGYEALVADALRWRYLQAVAVPAYSVHGQPPYWYVPFKAVAEGTTFAEAVDNARTQGIAQEEQEPLTAHAWKKYRQRGVIEMRPYLPGEDMRDILVSDADKKLPTLEGGMIVRGLSNGYAYQWYMSKSHFDQTMEVVEE